MVTVLDGPTYSDATATMKENSKDKISSKEQFKFYQFENDLVAVAKDDFLGLNCSMDYYFFLLCCLSLYCLRRKRSE
jgi:hypothetical protein